MLEGVAKIFQRQVYSWLSSKCGLPICIAGLLIALISALQFGETFLEWSKERYEAQFSIYADNLAGRSFERHMCPELPIDVVYTWVNGSDHKLIRELRKLKNEMEKDEEQPTSPQGPHNGSNGTDAHQQSTCPFPHCVPWRCLVLDARNMSHDQLTVETARSLSPLLSLAVDCRYVNTSGGLVSPVYALSFPREELVTACVKEGQISLDHKNISATRGYLTSDEKLVGAVVMADVALLTSPAINGTSTKTLRKWAELHFKGNITEVEVKEVGVAVARFRPGALEHVLTGNHSYRSPFSDEVLTVHQAYLVWVPFSLPEDMDLKVDGDETISASRFEDNEELRYSLRSVELNAPWVRHIFIVTNGQIPAWLNLDNPRVSLITHEDIFPDHSHLPTYSSPAIETHLHRIPGLSKRFIYMNDDVMFGDKIWPEDFYTPQRGQKVFLSWPVPNCAEGCPSSWITDRYCDASCNNSACDWDGGDCENATGPGWQGGYRPWAAHTYSDAEYCNYGCLNSWLGDRYCDQACRVFDCGYDAGDCGTDNWDELLNIRPAKVGGNYTIPLGTTSMFFNLTDLFPNGTITSAEHTPSKVIRTAVVAQKYKTLSITFSKNVTRATATFTIVGTVNETQITVCFNLTADTATKNLTVYQGKASNDDWNFPNFTSNSDEFLRSVSVRIQNANKSINYWVTERPTTDHTLPPPTSITNYTVTNTSLLPAEVREDLSLLELEYDQGDLTQKGFLKKRAQLLAPFGHLVTANGTLYFEPGNQGRTDAAATDDGGVATVEGGMAEGQEGVAKGVGVTRGHHVELLQDGGGWGGGRRLMGASNEEVLADMVATRKHKELTVETEVLRGVAHWESKYGRWDPTYSTWESRRRLPWEKLRVFPDAEKGEGPYSTGPHRTRKLMDAYADSLLHVNRLYNKAFGHEARKVPAHMPHMIDRDIMAELQEYYRDEFERTSSHKLRGSEDMQFSFSYFYYLMSVRRVMNLEDVYAELDTDKSGVLSVRELRTLLARINDLPLDLTAINNFESLLRECDKHFNGTRPSVDPIEFETHYDPDLPLVTLDFTRTCKPLIEKINSTFKTQPKYKFEEVGEGAVAFKMVNENASTVMQMLDEIRREKKKFVCLNDNIDHTKEGAALAKLVLLDFYESFFPLPSQFELPPQYRNRFLHTSELNEWLRFRGNVQLMLQLACAVLLLLCLISLFYGKIVQCRRKATRLLGTYLRLDRTRPSTV